MNCNYLKTKVMAEYLGYSSDFLLNNRGLLFFEGEHFFPQGKRINWKVSKMEKWVENKSISTQALEILEMVS